MFTHKIDPKKILPQTSLKMVGSVVYHGAPDDRRSARIAIVSDAYFSLLFSCNRSIAKIAKKYGEDSITPTDKQRLNNHLVPLYKARVDGPFIATMAEFYSEDELVEWSRYMSYVIDGEKVYRGFIFYPGEDMETIRPMFEYISPLLTGLREKGEFLSMEFEVRDKGV